MIRLRNLAPLLRTYELPPELDPAQGVKQKVGSLSRDRKRTADKHDPVSLVVRKQTVGRTVTLTARGTDGDMSGPLPECWLKCPTVEAHRKAGELQIIPHLQES